MSEWDRQRALVAAGERQWPDFLARTRAPHSRQGASAGPPRAPRAADPRQAPAARPHAAGVPSRRSQRSRAPSDRYGLAATDGERLYTPEGEPLALGAVDSAEALAGAARALLGPDPAEVTVWVSGAALERFGVLERPPFYDDRGAPAWFDGGTCWGDAGGWWTFDPPGGRAHVAVAPWLGVFDLGAAPDLLESAAAFRDALGFALAYSPPATVRALWRNVCRVGAPWPAPPVDAGADCAWRVPGWAWIAPEVAPELARRGWAALYDRNGSYLAATSGAILSDGPWAHAGPGRLEPGPESRRAAGYWRVGADVLASLTDPALPDPFARWRLEGDPWLTTPLVQLALDRAGAGGLEIRESWTAAASRKVLDRGAERVAAARDTLRARTDPAGAAAYAALKTGYAGAVAGLEWGLPEGHPMRRPDWRRTIVDRHAANTWRAFDRCAWAPLVATGIDSAAFALEGPDAHPAGLRLGDGLGAWKRKGRPVPLGPVLDMLAEGNAAGAVALLEGDA